MSEQQNTTEINEPTCNQQALTPETNRCREAMNHIRPDGTYRIDAMTNLMQKMENSLRKLHTAYTQKIQGEIQLGHFDKEALNLLTEIQRNYPSFSENR